MWILLDNQLNIIFFSYVDNLLFYSSNILKDTLVCDSEISLFKNILIFYYTPEIILGIIFIKLFKCPPIFLENMNSIKIFKSIERDDDI